MIKDYVIDQKLINSVSADSLMNYTKNITKEVRLSGSDEELRAFYYIKDQLESFGLETQLIFHEAYISLPIKAELMVNEVSFECITHSMAQSTDGITKDICYIDDFQTFLPTEEVVDKIILTEGIATPGAVAQIENWGAAGAIFINGPHTHEMIVSKVWGNPTSHTKDFYPSIPVISITNQSGDSLKSMLQQTESPLQAYMKTKVETAWTNIPQLTAEIKGEVEPEKFVLFSGHVDSWHYGAMDNGGANATMLEVARVLTEQHKELRRSLRFAFWSGHSHGRYAGSTYYSDENFEDLFYNCMLHVYIDSVGGKGAHILGESNCMQETKSYGGLFVKQLHNEDFIGKRFGRGGDQSFWGHGIPALFMGLSEQPLSDDVASQTLVKLFGGVKSGGFGWWWHTTEDTIDKLSPENLKRDCEIYLSVLYDACNRKVIPYDFRAGIKEMTQAIESYKEISRGELNLSLTFKRLKVLDDQFIQVNNNLLQIDDWEINDRTITEINNRLRLIANILIPLNYVKDEIYEHDLAINLPVVPSLEGMHDFVKAEKGSHEYFSYKTQLKRSINKVNHQLRLAIEVIEELMDRFKEIKEEIGDINVNS